MKAYVQEIQNIETEMKRLRKRLKDLSELKQKPTQALYQYMVSHNLTRYEGIRIEKISPPPPKHPRKTPTQKKEDALKFFRGAGVGNPESFYQQYLLTQKNENPEE